MGKFRLVNQTPHILRLPFSRGDYVWIMVKCNHNVTSGYDIESYDHIGPIFRPRIQYNSYIKIERKKFRYALLDIYKIEELYPTKEACEYAYYLKYNKKYEPYIKTYPLGNQTPSSELR